MHGESVGLTAVAFFAAALACWVGGIVEATLEITAGAAAPSPARARARVIFMVNGGCRDNGVVKGVVELGNQVR